MGDVEMALAIASMMFLCLGSVSHCVVCLMSTIYLFCVDGIRRWRGFFFCSLAVITFGLSDVEFLSV